MKVAALRGLIDRIAGVDRERAARSGPRRWAEAATTSAVLIAVISLAISVLDDHAPVLPLIVLYLLAVVPVAVAWGAGFATAVSLVSVVLFAYIFVPPAGRIELAKSDTWYALLAFVFTAVVVSELTSRLQRAAHASARLAEEQGALRRVATLVAQQTTTPETLDALICEQVGTMLSVDLAVMHQFDDDGNARLMGRWARAAPLGEAVPAVVTDVLEMVARTSTAARVNGQSVPSSAQRADMSAVGAPIVVESKLWGAIVVAADSAALPENTGDRLADFTALVAIAIANAKNRAELAASRQRLVVAADRARRRIERDLHDGTQQHLVALAMDLQAIRDGAPEDLPELRAELSRVTRGLIDTMEEIREIARGIHPAILAQGGLGPALRTLGRRCPVAVDVQVDVGDRLAEQVEVAAYYVVAESLTNAAKHAQARQVQVTGNVSGGLLRILICDDGRGGASLEGGSGLIGINDRVNALGGTLVVHSPPGAGTTVKLEMPVDPGAESS